MGGQLPSTGAGKPTFLVAARQDPGTLDHPGTPLQRLQIIKGWITENGQHRERVINVAGDAYSEATVDIRSCETRGEGFAQLCTVLTDEDFKPGEQAYYYSRVVENPSCRWSTFQCNALPEAERPASCSDPDVPKTIQERAWTSPIWYTSPATK